MLACAGRWCRRSDPNGCWRLWLLRPQPEGVVSRRGGNTSLDSGGRGGVVASCGEGTGSSPAVGQASAVHGVAGSRLECSRRGPRSRCISILGGELVAWTRGLPQRRRGRVRPAAGSAGGPLDQHALPIAGRAHRDRRSTSVPPEPAGDRRTTRSSAIDDITGAAAQTAARPCVSPVRCSSAAWSPSCLVRRWSPQQISRHLRLRIAEDPSMRLCHQRIQKLVYQPNSRFLRPLR